MSTWGPWYLVDDATSIKAPANLSRHESIQNQLRREANAAFNVYLFARRQDQDDFAFFYVRSDGVVDDSVIASHLTFPSGPNHDTPTIPVDHVHRMNLEQWLKDIAIPEMMDWLAFDEEDPD
jgi:hypothetical protein